MAEMKHLHLFPTSVPKDQLMIVVNAVRGVDDGRSNRDRVEAAWWCAGYGLSFIPDSHPVDGVAALSDEECCKHLESLAGGDEGVRGLIPWDRLVTKLWELILAWLEKQ